MQTPFSTVRAIDQNLRIIAIPKLPKPLSSLPELRHRLQEEREETKGFPSRMQEENSRLKTGKNLMNKYRSKRTMNTYVPKIA